MHFLFFDWFEWERTLDWKLGEDLLKQKPISLLYATDTVF